MCHYATDKSCADFRLKLQQNAFGGRALPGPAGKGYTTPQTSWLDLTGEGRDKGMEKTGGKGICEGGDRRRREGWGWVGRRDGRGGEGEEGQEKSHPRSFPKIGAYGSKLFFKSINFVNRQECNH